MISSTIAAPSHSRLASIHFCERKYFYAYHRELKSTEQFAPAYMGQAMHAGLETYHRSGDSRIATEALEAAWGSQRFFGDYDWVTPGHASLVLRSYMGSKHTQEWEPVRLRRSDLNAATLMESDASEDDAGYLVLAEASFVVDVPGLGPVNVRPDLLLKVPTGLRVVDHKPQPVSCNVFTPDGWKTLGDVALGDAVIGSNGKATKVVGVFRKGTLKTYKVRFNDGSEVRCSEGHLWSVKKDKWQAWKTLPVEEIGAAPPSTFYIPVIAPVEHAEKDLPLDPYVLGALLGDGSFRQSSIVLSAADAHLVGAVGERLPARTQIKKASVHNYSWTISGAGQKDNDVNKAIKALGLKGADSLTTFVPEIYKLASIEQRLQLLRGLLDTDGCTHKGYVLYDTISPSLRDDACDIVRSLGGTAMWRRMGGTNHPRFRVSIRLPVGMYPFHVKDRFIKPIGPKRRFIVAVEESSPEESVCLAVDSTDQLYATEHYILTHNTTTSYLGSNVYNTTKYTHQLRLYALAMGALLGQPVAEGACNAIYTGKSAANPGFKGNRYEMYTFDYSPADFEETRAWYKAGRRKMEHMAEHYTEQDELSAPQNPGSHCGYCDYSKLCSAPAALRGGLIRINYKRKQEAA